MAGLLPKKKTPHKSQPRQTGKICRAKGGVRQAKRGVVMLTEKKTILRTKLSDMAVSKDVQRKKEEMSLPSRTSRWFACQYHRTGRSSDQSVGEMSAGCVHDEDAPRRPIESMATALEQLGSTHGGRLAGVDVAVVASQYWSRSKAV